MYSKPSDKKLANCFGTFLQNKLNSDVARAIAIQLVLKQCCKISCTFAVAHFAVLLEKSCFRSDEHVLGKKRGEAGKLIRWVHMHPRLPHPCL